MADGGYAVGKVGAPGVSQTAEQVANEEARKAAALEEFDAAQVIINRAAQAHEDTEPERLQALAREESMRYAPDLPADLVPEADVGYHPGGDNLGWGAQQFQIAEDMFPGVGYAKAKRPLYDERNQQLAVHEDASLRSDAAQRELLNQQGVTQEFLAGKEAELSLYKDMEASAEQERQRAVVERNEQIYRETQEQFARQQAAAQELAKAPPEDPGRWWHDADAGKRAGFIIGSIFYGMLGGDPLRLINTAIDRDINAQRANFDRLKSSADAEAGLTKTKLNVWADARAGALSDDEANLLAKNAYLEAFKQQVVAGLHQRGLAERQPMVEKFLADLDAQLADQTFRIQQLRAANTKYVHRKVYYDKQTGEPMSREEAKFNKEMAKERYKAGIDDQKDSAKAMRGHVYDVDLEGVKARGKKGEDIEAAGLTKEEHQMIRSRGSSKEYLAARKMKRITDRLLEITRRHGGNVPDTFGPFELGGRQTGISGDLTNWLRSEDKEIFDEWSDMGAQLDINMITGANSTPEQQRVADIAFGKVGSSAGQRARAIEQIDQMLNDFIVEEERFLTDRAREFVHRNPDLPTPSPSSVSDAPTRATLESVTEVDE